jgi:DNA-binding transcriptional regulator of glucitol operon
MKARVIKTKNLEKQKKQYLDLLNDLVWNKGSLSLKSSQSKAFESVNSDVSNSGYNLGGTLLTSVAVSGYSSINTTNSLSFPKESFISMTSYFDTNEASESSENEENSKIQVDSQKQNASAASLPSQKYKPMSKLNDANYGTSGSRSIAIYAKLIANNRMIQVDDLKSIDAITKSQNTGIMSMSLSGGVVGISTISGRMCKTVQTKVFYLGMMGLFASMGAMSNANWKYTKFMRHVNDKYFYGQTLDELKETTLIKTNKPRNISYEKSSWSLRSKVASLMA